MRIKVRIDDDLMVELKARAGAASVSLTQMLNRTLRIGLRTPVDQAESRRTFQQRTYRMGLPRLRIGKALALAAQLEDEDVAAQVKVVDVNVLL